MIPAAPSNHFEWHEVDPTGKGRADPTIAANLIRVASGHGDAVRDACGCAVTVSAHGGYHPPGGFDDGWDERPAGEYPHHHGIALDLLCPAGMKLRAFHAICRDVHARMGGGLGLYHGFAHVDCRSQPVVWGPDGHASSLASLDAVYAQEDAA